MRDGACLHLWRGVREAEPSWDGGGGIIAVLKRVISPAPAAEICMEGAVMSCYCF